MASTNPASSSSLGINTSGDINVSKPNVFAWIVGALVVVFGGIWLVKRRKLKR